MKIIFTHDDDVPLDLAITAMLRISHNLHETTELGSISVLSSPTDKPMLCHARMGKKSVVVHVEYYKEQGSEQENV